MKQVERNNNGAIFVTTKNTSGLFRFYYLKKREHKDGTFDWHLCVELKSAPGDKYMIMGKVRGSEDDARLALNAMISSGDPVRTAHISVPASVLERIEDYLGACSNGYQGEDNTISYTAKFDNGMEMDIKCCGCDDDSSWLEAVLFKDGSEVACTEPDYGDFDSTWQIEYNGVLYETVVCRECQKVQVGAEYVQVMINRAGKNLSVPFCCLKTGDQTINPKYPMFTCGGDAHKSGDASYDGYIVYDDADNGYFPEDFGAIV